MLWGEQRNTDLIEAVIWSLSIPGGSWGPALGSGHHFSALGICFDLLCDWQYPLHGYNGKVCAALAGPPPGAAKGAELPDYNLLFLTPSVLFALLYPLKLNRYYKLIHTG